MPSSQQEDTEKSAQTTEIQSILKRTGWTIEELADKAAYSVGTLKKALSGTRPLPKSSMDVLRYAAFTKLGGMVSKGDDSRTLLLDTDLQDKLTGIISNGQPDHITLLRDLVNVVYTRATGKVEAYGRVETPSPIIRFPIGHLLRPILGRIAAGAPQESLQQTDEWLAIPPRTAKEVDYVLKVSGNSMIDRDIFEGDLVYMNLKRDPRNGDIVAALCDHETCLKTFVAKPGKQPFLKAENKDYPQEIRALDELAIQGVMVGKHNA